VSAQLEAALALARAGCPVFPCRPDKAPLVVHGHKRATADTEQVRTMWGAHPDALIGIPTGAASGLWVADLDIDKATGEHVGEASVAALGIEPPPYVQRTRSGGVHWLYRHRNGLPGNTAKRLPGLDTRGDGGYFIAYDIDVVDDAIHDPALPEPPEKLLQALAKPIPNPNGTAYAFRPGDAKPWAEKALAEEAGAVAGTTEGSRNHQLNRAAFKLGQIVGGGGLDQGRVEAELFAAAAACGLDPREAAKAIDSGLTAGMAEPRGPEVELPKVRGSRSMGASNMTETDAPHAEPDEGDYDLPTDVNALPLVLDRKGKYPEACLENIGLVLESLRPWQGVFAYDELAAAVMLMMPIPGTSVSRATFRPRELRDGDVIATTRWLNKRLHPRTPSSMVGEIINQVARRTVLSPVADYLKALKWDGIERLDAWTMTYLSAEDTPFNRAAGRAWLISAVARALRPGVKADCALILEGGQGVFKSMALEILASTPWFFDGLQDFKGKDASHALRGKWIIELPELAAMQRSEVETIKAYLSRTTERYRPAYGRNEVTEPRRCVFAGSTNSKRYLRDTTGNRRFWPIPVGFIDIPGLERDRDQLWAEAVTRYRAGERWWLDAGMEKVAATVVAERTEEDPWSAAFATHLIGLSETSTRDCLNALDMPPGNQTRAAAMRASEVLLALGWTPAGRFNGGVNRKLTRYVRPGTSAETS